MARREQFSVDVLTLGFGGKALKLYKEFTASITPTVLTANTVSAQTFTFTGVKVGDKVVALVPPSAFNAVATIAVATVSAADTVTIKFLSAGTTAPTSGNWTVAIVRT